MLEKAPLTPVVPRVPTEFVPTLVLPAPVDFLKYAGGYRCSLTSWPPFWSKSNCRVYEFSRDWPLWTRALPWLWPKDAVANGFPVITRYLREGICITG